MKPSKYSQTRRLFMQRAVAVGAAGMAPYIYTLEAMAAAAADNAGNRVVRPGSGVLKGVAAAAPGYKALVCLFMFGGNDNANFIIPYDLADYNVYAAARTNMAIPRTGDPSVAVTAQTMTNMNQRGLIPIGPFAGQGGRSFAFHPNVGKKAGGAEVAALRSDGLPRLWDEGNLALVANVGPLAMPMTKIEYTNKTKTRPQNLFSHSDQQTTWMTSAATGYSPTGVGGRIADLVDSMNVPMAGQPRISTCISIAGVNTYQVAESVQPYQINTSGPIGLSSQAFYTYSNYTAINSAITKAFNDQITRPRGNHFETQWGGMMNYSLQTRAAINTALALPESKLPGTAPSYNFRTSGNSLSSQLLMVAKLINASAALGMQRQIFFVQIGGFDVHGNEFHPQNNTNWSKISEAVYDFHQAMAGIGAEDQVTLFSASDFGRTLDSNGLGTDHGWGGHHFVSGGAVNGGQIYGTFPTVALGGNDDIGRGSLLPTTSTDQFHATLARWFGLTDPQIATVLPNLYRFSPATLGFV
ncbi:MAG: DUF1501 domain-containing protein [Casimicrobiaceae bacterium]